MSSRMRVPSIEVPPMEVSRMRVPPISFSHGLSLREELSPHGLSCILHIVTLPTPVYKKYFNSLPYLSIINAYVMGIYPSLNEVINYVNKFFVAVFVENH
jgi:hypothetical protein